MTEKIIEIRTRMVEPVCIPDYSYYERKLQYIELRERIDRLDYNEELRGRGNPNHDEKGRFCSGNGGGGSANLVVDKSGESGIIKKRDGKDRASDFAQNWSKASLNKTIKKFNLNQKSAINSSGKVIYSSNSTNIQIVYDVNGNYFRIQDKTISYKKRSAYLDINGKSAQNIIENGKTRGRSKIEFQRDTHFLNIDEK